jgi:LemA protein
MTHRWSHVLRTVQVFVLALAAMAALSGCQKYDDLIEKDQIVLQRWADLEANLQRRADLVPNLVNTVKASADYEKSTLEQITQARAAATQMKLSVEDLSDPAKMRAFEEAQQRISSSAISRLLVANENYPKLQASGQFGDLMKQLEGTENRILRSREQYNDAVRQYNAELGKIRGSVVNKATGAPFKPREYYTASPEATGAAPQVQF